MGRWNVEGEYWSLGMGAEVQKLVLILLVFSLLVYT